MKVDGKYKVKCQDDAKPHAVGIIARADGVVIVFRRKELGRAEPMIALSPKVRQSQASAAACSDTPAYNAMSIPYSE